MTVDMSAKAVTARLKLASQLRHLWLAVGQAKKVDANRSDADHKGQKSAQRPEIKNLK
jgi:hypothetical protein